MFKIIIIIIAVLSIIDDGKSLMKKLRKSDSEIETEVLELNKYGPEQVFLFIAMFFNYFYYVFALKEIGCFETAFKSFNILFLAQGIIMIIYNAITTGKSEKMKENRLSPEDKGRFLKFYNIGAIITLLMDILMSAGILILFFVQKF